MAGKRITPEQKTKALTLRAAGHTITVISDKTGASVSALKRLFNEYAVSKGELSKKAVEKATDALLHDASAIDQIKREVAALIMDDVAIAKRLRQAMAEAADQLVAADTNQALQVMRAVSSGAVALKSTSETLRKSLGMDKDSDVSDELPELMITIMTDEEIEDVKQAARQKLVGFSDGIGGVLSEEEEEIIEYDHEEVLHAID